VAGYVSPPLFPVHLSDVPSRPIFHDAQYSQDECDSHVGWGQSSVHRAVTLARAAGVRQLLLFHHDPSHSDAELEGLLSVAIRSWDGSGHPPALAYEGMTVTLESAGVAIGP
jgi:ribonuclease BN (tRNA processing enzyme)